jgi:hypothetical protein
MSVLMSTISRVVCAHYKVSEAQMRLTGPEKIDDARAAFLWIADQVSDLTRATAALWIGCELLHAHDLRHMAEERRDADRAYANSLDELAVESMATQGVHDRLKLIRPERDPAEIAVALIKGRGVVSTIEMQSLAAAFVALDRPKTLSKMPNSIAADLAVTVQLNVDIYQAALAAAIAQKNVKQMAMTTDERLALKKREAALDALVLIMADDLPQPKPHPNSRVATTLKLTHGDLR